MISGPSPGKAVVWETICKNWVAGPPAVTAGWRRSGKEIGLGSRTGKEVLGKLRNRGQALIVVRRCPDFKKPLVVYKISVLPGITVQQPLQVVGKVCSL